MNGCSSDTKYSDPLMLHRCLFHNDGLSYPNTVFINPFCHSIFSQILTSSIFFFDPSAIVTCVHATKHDDELFLTFPQSDFAVTLSQLVELDSLTKHWIFVSN
jgi:hypothetical protein